MSVEKSVVTGNKLGETSELGESRHIVDSVKHKNFIQNYIQNYDITNAVILSEDHVKHIMSGDFNVVYPEENISMIANTNSKILLTDPENLEKRIYHGKYFPLFRNINKITLLIYSLNNEYSSQQISTIDLTHMCNLREFYLSIYYDPAMFGFASPSCNCLKWYDPKFNINRNNTNKWTVTCTITRNVNYQKYCNKSGCCMQQYMKGYVSPHTINIISYSDITTILITYEQYKSILNLM